MYFFFTEISVNIISTSIYNVFQYGNYYIFNLIFFFI